MSGCLSLNWHCGHGPSPWNRANASRDLHRRRRRWLLLLLPLFTLGCFRWPLAAAHAQDAVPANQDPLRFRMIFAPPDQIDRMAQGDYRPMPRDEFHRRLRALQYKVPTEVEQGAALRQASYTARLEGRRLLVGTAVWQIQRQRDEPVWLSLGNMNLALSDPHWLASDEAPGERLDADLGNSVEGACLLAVPRSGALQSRWTLAPVSAPGLNTASSPARGIARDDWVFDLQLPPCPVTRLDLQLPADLELKADHGVVRSIALNQDPVAAESGASTTPAVNVWQIDLGGRHACQLRLRRRNTPEPQVRLRQLTRYSVSEQGLDVTADLALDCDEMELDRLELRADPPLRITKVVHESQVLSWSDSSPADDAGVTTVEFAPPLRGLNRTVRVSAVAPPDISAAWQLPRIRVTGVDWLQESARLQIHPPFVLQDLQLTHGLRLRSTDDTGPGPRTMVAQFFDPEHAVQLRLAPEAQPATFKTATHVTVGPNELLATMEVDIRSRSADLFEIDAVLQDEWNLESVEAAEAEVLDQWQVVSSPTAARQLRLRFRRPLSTESWTRLTLRARRAFKPGPEPMPIRHLRPIEFAEHQPAPRQFLSIPPQIGVAVNYPNDGKITWLSLDDLDAREAHLLGAQARERLILLDRHSLAETVVLNEAPDHLAPVSAKLETTVEVSRRLFKERLRVELSRVPQPPQHFHIRLSQSRPGEIRWFLASAPQQELSAERVAQSDGDGAGERWRIAWPDTTEASLVVVGERSWPTAEGGPVALAKVEEADTQEGIAVVQGALDVDLSLHAPALFTPLPVAPTAFRRFDVSRYRFRYAPIADIFSPDNWLTVQVSPAAESGSRLVVWREAIDTHLDQSGIYRVEVRLWTENLGADSLDLRLPPDSILRQTHVNRQEITTDSDLHGWLEIPLPAGERFPLIRLRYDQPGRGLDWLQTIRYESPQFAVPVLHRQWSIWTPPEYGLSTRGEHALGLGPASLSPPRLRPPQRRPFNLFSLDDWRQQVRQLTRPHDQLTSQLVGALAALGEPAQLTAGGWLRSLGGQDVEVDAIRLAELGVQPSSPLPATSAADNVRRGIDRLQRLHLSLLEVDGRLCVSTESALAELPGAVLCRESASVAKLDGPAAAAWWDAVRQPARVVRVPASDWKTTPVTWQTEPRARAPYIAAGWQLHRISLPAQARVTVYRASAWRVLGCAGFLATMALTWWLARRWPRPALVVPLVGLATALLAATPLNGLGVYAFAGSLLGWCVPRFRTASNGSPSQVSVQRAGRAAMTASMSLLLMFGGGAGLVRAQTASVLERPPLEVFVPTDDQGKPQGEHLIVPLELQRRLLAPAAAGGSSPAWVLAQATYTGVLEPQADASQLQLSTITADFELHVARLGGAIQFPLVAEAVTALKREAFLDGRRIQLHWDANHSTLALPIQQAGRHHLQLSFQTLTTTENGLARVELPIPRTAWATLVLTSPQDPQSIQVPSARGAIQRRESTGQLRAEIGPSDRLRIQWPTTATAQPAPAIDQLSWLRLERDEVRYDVQLIPDLTRILDASLVLEVDERLQLDVAVSDQPLSLAPAAERGVRRLEFDLVQAVGDSPVIQLSFVLTGTTGVGHVRLPRCRVLNHNVRHWLAVSADERLGPQVTPDTAVRLLVDEFVATWGGTQSPQFAYELPAGPINWSCEGQWIESQPTVEVQEAQVVGREGTRLVLVATFRTDDRELFQQALVVPEDFQIESIQRLPTSVGAPLRWSRYASEHVAIFFDDPPIGTFQIGIIGYRADSTLQARRLPRIDFPEARTDRRQVDIFRESDVVVQDVPAASQTAIPEVAPFLRNQIGLARWLSRRESSHDSTWTISLQPNERRIRARLDNVVARDQGTWSHRLLVHVEVEEGVLDSLTFELPEAWTAGLQEDAQMRAQMRVTYAQASQPGMVRVTFWPQLQPLAPVSPILFPGQPIPVGPGQPLTVPNIRLLSAGEIERRLFLPVKIEEQAILWTVSGLDPLADAAVPPPLAQPEAAYQAYRIPDGPFQATRLPANSTVDKPIVSLVDLQIAWQEEGRFEGLLLFDLQPDGLGECWLEYPAGVGPIATYIDGLPVRLPDRAEADSGKMLQPVQLASYELPQRIRVLVSGRVASSAANGGPAIPLPRLCYRTGQNEALQEIPVTQTLCTLYQLAPGTLQLSGELANAMQLDAHRLTHLADVLDQATRLATDYSQLDLEHWYWVWGRRFVGVQERLRTLAASGSADDATRQVIGEARQRHAAVLPQLKVDAIFQKLQAERELNDSTRVWLDAMPTAVGVQYQAIPTSVGQLSVRFEPAAEFHWPWRVAIVLAAAMAGVALQRWPRSPREVAPRWPMVAGVLVGLAWWLWLEPSLLGWGIVGLSLLVMVLLP